MMDALKDARTLRLMRELSRRFPGTTLVTSPRRDAPGSGEILVQVLNAPVRPADAVERVARRWIWKLWGDDPWPVYVEGVSPENTLKYHAADLARAQRAQRTRRRRTRTSRRRATTR
jgi:hypothetical protein